MYNTPFAPDHEPRIIDSLTIHADCGNEWIFPSHAHDNYVEISFLAEGSCLVEMNGCIYGMNSGDILIKRPQCIHREAGTSEGPLTLICLILDGVHFHGSEPGELLMDSAHTQLISAGHQDLMKAIFTELERSPQNQEESLYLLNAFLVTLRRMERENLIRLPKQPAKEDIVNSIRIYIDENYGKKLSLKSLSELFYLSPGYMEKLFTNAFGANINQYITERRMGEAERSLLFTDDDIKLIAGRCGYQDIHYFYNVFKKCTGMTPVEFRRKMRQ